MQGPFMTLPHKNTTGAFLKYTAATLASTWISSLNVRSQFTVDAYNNKIRSVK